MRFIYIISLSILTWIALGCGGNKSTKSQAQKENSLSGSIKIDGSSTVYPVTEAIAEEFRSIAPDVRVTIGVSGTGGGFKKFARGETDISNASRPIKDKESKACSDNGIGYLELPVAYDGIAVVVNPENSWASTIKVDELKKIWEPGAQGKITNWNQIRAEYPDLKLVLMGPGSASGTFDYFTEAVVGESGSSRGDYMPSEDDHVLVQGVAGDKGALGFFGLAYYEENKDKLKLLSVETEDGAIFPTLETVKDGSYKPLSRPIFIYVSDQSATRSEVSAFINFYLTEASGIVPDVGYIPLPDDMYSAGLAKFKAFVTGN